MNSIQEKNLNQNPNTWQRELAAGFSNSRELCEYLDLSSSTANALPSPTFAVRVPRDFVDRIEKGNLADPLLKQVLAAEQENKVFSGFNNDPVGDINAVVEPGVIHKYQGRVLLITTGSCAINCRYCFRRNFPYSDFQLSKQKLDQALQYIQNDNTISEVILSGGDPLLLSDQKLFSLIQQLENIKHIKRIRIHSRIPIVLPSRINSEFCDLLSSIQKPVVLVIHSNHANELSHSVKMACEKLTACHITLLNQSVLLKGINDTAQSLSDLSEKLFEFGILPYYLHLLDKATGTQHFEVDNHTAIALMDKIKQQLPGYLVPKLVREQAGMSNKIIIS
ncbi:MAG: EF-P beta-lysylation protein EpmB [Methylococcales bacterium]|nr:EF-P beta-lysylation protein EpmB [Methylococcales bacterium]